MTHNSKEMCVSEDKVEKIVSHQFDLLKSDLTGAFNTQFEGVKKDLEYIKEQTTKTNSRTTTNEKNIAELKKLESTKEVTCPFRKNILDLETKSIESDILRDYLEAQEEKSDRGRQRFYTKMQGYGAIIMVIVAILAFGVDIVDIVKSLFTQ